MPIQQESKQPRVQSRRKSLELTLNAVIVVLLLVVVYFSYAFISRNLGTQPSASDTIAVHIHRAIQLDVLNGCGVRGVGLKLTNYLRTAGFDVVESKNYKVFNVPQTLVIDRVGNLTAARRVAAALGIADNNIIQQINPDYYVDVSVIIGGDYLSLQPLR